jgi:hypothetical protein
MDQAFTVPNAYFSPLTSPALHAQSDPMAMFERGLSTATTTSSPEGMDLEANQPPSSGPAANDLAKKGRKTNPAKTRARASVGKSPITKPQRKKTGATPLMNAQTLIELSEKADKSAEPRARPAKENRQAEPSELASNSSTTGITDSENDSLSPEALSEMPPPPLPKTKSARPSPCIQPQNNVTPTLAPTAAPPQPTGKPSPATPASLMRLPSPSNANKSDTPTGSDPMASENFENFELPESVSSSQFKKPHLAPLTTQQSQIRSPSVETPSGTASSFQPLPSPVFAKPGAAASASQSPQLTPGSSTTTPNPRKTPQLAPRSGKKRASISSSHVSPALRPRISPSIKPLLPGGLRAEDSASQLLASKSNYQNILEGNKVPGVSYPSELSTNLTSKRTSHKIAEQGRRNRINSALQEIATLLPSGLMPEGKDSGAESGDKKDPKDSKNSGGPNSKASTVESAIDYIKQLKKDLEAKDKELEAQRKRAELAEKKLQEKEGAAATT